MQGLLAAGDCGGAGAGGILSAVFAGGAGKRRRWTRPSPDRTKLNQEVTQLQVYKQRYGELKSADGRVEQATGYAEDHRAGRKRNRRIYPFGAGRGERSPTCNSPLTARQIVTEGISLRDAVRDASRRPVFQYSGFLRPLSRLSRIINVGDLQFADPMETPRKARKYPLRPGTTVSGIFTITTYFTKPADTTERRGRCGKAGVKSYSASE